MKREDEIGIIIEYLKKEVIEVSNRYSSLLTNTIIKNGKLIESYKNELEELKKE
jgi:hypothetical protein